jgi:hypothetical protein
MAADRLTMGERQASSPTDLPGAADAPMARASAIFSSSALPSKG